MFEKWGRRNHWGTRVPHLSSRSLSILPIILSVIRLGVSVRLGPVKATVELNALLYRWSIVFSVFTSTATMGALGRRLVTLVAVVSNLRMLDGEPGTIVSPGRLVLVRRTVARCAITLAWDGAPRKLRSE